ncbi:TPA: replication initiator protein A [Enterococcus faecium]
MKFVQLKTENTNQSFFQMPVALMRNEKYKGLSLGAKMAYTLFLNRHHCSASHGYKDKLGNTYFYYTNEELMEDLGRGNKAVSKIKKELIEHGLLKVVRRPPKRTPDGQSQFQASLLYLGEIQASENEVYKRPNKQTKHHEKKKPVNELEKNKNADAEITEEERKQEKEESREKFLLDNFAKTIQSFNRTFIPENALMLIQKFSNSVKEAKDTVKAIHNAKVRAQQQTGEYILFEEIEESCGINAEAELYTTLHRAYMLQKTEKINNIKNVIHVYVRNWFMNTVIPTRKLALDNTLPKVSIANWLDD